MENGMEYGMENKLQQNSKLTVEFCINKLNFKLNDYTYHKIEHCLNFRINYSQIQLMSQIS